MRTPPTHWWKLLHASWGKCPNLGYQVRKKAVTCWFLENWQYIRNTTSSCIKWEGFRVLNTSRVLPSSSSTSVSPPFFERPTGELWVPEERSGKWAWYSISIPQWPWPCSLLLEMTLEKMLKCCWRMLFTSTRNQLWVSQCLSRPGWCEDPTWHLYLCKVVFEQFVIRMHLRWKLFSWAPLPNPSCAQKLAGFLIILAKY